MLYVCKVGRNYLIKQKQISKIKILFRNCKMDIHKLKEIHYLLSLFNVYCFMSKVEVTMVSNRSAAYTDPKVLEPSEPIGSRKF